MPAATTKAELIAVTETEFSKLHELIDPLTEQDARLGDGEVTIKDVIGHRAHWIGLFLGWYMDGQAGKAVAFPAPGYKWNELNRYNADLRQWQAGYDWSRVKAMLGSRYLELHAFLDTKTEAALYGGPMKGAKSHWTVGRWAEASGASHFRSATKFIRATLRARPAA